MLSTYPPDANPTHYQGGDDAAGRNTAKRSNICLTGNNEMTARQTGTKAGRGIMTAVQTASALYPLTMRAVARQSRRLPMSADLIVALIKQWQDQDLTVLQTRILQVLDQREPTRMSELTASLERNLSATTSVRRQSNHDRH